jgi:hypothetical protein
MINLVFAFCGFFVAGNDAKLYNDASQVVLVRENNHTIMTLSNNYKGPPENFAMVVPVPVVLQKEDVKTLPSNVFDRIDQLSAPRLVEYWEQDPCRPLDPPRPKRAGGGMKYKKSAEAPMKDDDLGVKVEAQFVVGEYEIVILSAKDSGGLDTWLRLHKYTIPQGAAEALAPYVREQSKFFVAKVDIKKVNRDGHGDVVLSPLRFGFDSTDLRLPVRLGLLNARDKQDLVVYVLSPSSRYEVSNYRNVFIPTNLDVANEVRDSFGAFYAQLFDSTLAPFQGKAIVTEYAWQTTSCDPCPTPPLTPSDMATLGAGGTNPARFGFSPWVLTRLHARYDKTSLSEDLIFREAKAMQGGRANWDGTSAEKSDPVESSVNNFQGRYIIRHYWEGPVACTNPRYNTWGGPPNGGGSAPKVARDLASQKRGSLNLKKLVHTSVPKLGIPGTPPPERKK